MTSTPDPGLAVAYRIAASVTWADIGARDGKTGKVAKRDAKRLAKKTSVAARLKANASRGVVLQREAAITSDGWCAAHHCFRTECTYRTHVRTVRCLDALWDKVAAKAAAKGTDTNAGVTAALEAWAASEG